MDQEGGTGNGSDGIKLYHFGARVYDPELGVWSSTDPKDQGWNAYVYCGGNPVNLVDPNGEFAEWLVWAAMAAGAIGGGIYGYEKTGTIGGALEYGLMGTVIGGLAGGAVYTGLNLANEAGQVANTAVTTASQTVTNTAVNTGSRILSAAVNAGTQIASTVINQSLRNTDAILDSRLKQFPDIWRRMVPEPLPKDMMCSWASEYMINGEIQSTGLSPQYHFYPKTVSETILRGNGTQIPGKGPQLVLWKNSHVGILNEKTLYHWNNEGLMQPLKEAEILFGKNEVFYPININF